MPQGMLAPRLVLVASICAVGCRGATTAAPDGDAQGKRTTDDAAVDVEAVLAKSDLPPTLSTPLADDPMGVTVHRLRNGLTVYISTVRDKPQFTAWIGVRAGSRMDPPDSTGLAHYLEHMLFKGSDEFGTLDADKEAAHVERVRKLYAQLRDATDEESRKQIFAEIDRETQEQAKYAVPNELDRMYSTLGVTDINAFTSLEQTTYIGSVPSNRLAQWATVEEERLADPVFRLFLPELEAVYEEKNLSLDRPGTRAWEAMQLALYPKHPYGTQTTIGDALHLKSPAYQDMADYFERWYVPNNMAIVLAGDIDPATALPVLEKQFSRLQPREVPPPGPGEVVPLKGRVLREVLGEGEESVSLAWHTVPIEHADEPALAVMDRLLDDASVGLLNVELELTQKVPRAGSWHSAMNESGYFGVQLGVRDGQEHEDVEAMALAVVAKLAKGEFTDADVAGVRLQQSVARKYERETSWARASRMMDAFIEHRSWQEVLARDEAFDRVTRDDVIRVAKKYLGDDKVVIHRRQGKVETPKLDKPKITPVKIDPSRKSEFARRVERMKAPQLQPLWAEEGVHYQHVKVPAGQLIASRNERNDLFSVKYMVDRGYDKEPLLCYALDLFAVSGAGTQSAEALQKELYALGSSVDTGCDAAYSWVAIEGIDANMEASLAVVDRWLADPKFDAGALARHYENTITKRRDHLEEDQYLTQALDTFAKYAGESAWLQHPSNAQLKKAKVAQLTKLMKSLLRFEHHTFYFGPRAPQDAADVVARKGEFADPGPLWVRKYRRVSAPAIYFLHKEGAKANVRFVIPRPPLLRDERPVAEVYSEYLIGNMSALVFQEIRESRGLAYSASSIYSDGRTPKDESGLLGFMSTQADKTPVAVATFLELLRTGEIQSDRLAAAKLSLDQNYRSSRIDPRWITAWVHGWDELGEKKDPRPWMWEVVQHTTPERVAAFSEPFGDAPVIIGIIGDRSRVGLDELKKIGQVTEVKPGDLFSYGGFPDLEK
jgi:predicted Zn-dependent peptidase